MDNKLYRFSPIVERPPLIWPDGARVAFYVGLNIEHYQIDKPSTSIFGGTAMLQPDPLNYGWRDYGPRVGFWRMLESLDRHHVPVSALINSDVCRHYPQIIDAGRERGWAWVAHGRDNSTFEAGMDADTELAYLREVTETIESATGARPRGWLGPALTETYDTPRLLAELGYEYVLDWTNDDQPYPLEIEGMLSVPYSIELNDVTMFLSNGYTGPEFFRAVIDQFDQLYADSAHTGRVMALCLHPFLIGQPFRHTYLDQALAYIAGHEGVWLTTSDAVADHYRDQRTRGQTEPAA